MRIRPATPHDTPALAALIAGAFLPLAPTHYLVNDPARRAPVMRAFLTIHITQGLCTGTVDVSVDDHDNPVGAGIWYDSSDPGPEDYASQLLAAVGDDEPRFSSFEDMLHHDTPPEPHTYLAFLAVHPTRQGTGIGTELLRHRHRQLTHTPAYLVASNEKARKLYLRHAYQDHGKPIVLPNGGRMFPMWRPARRLSPVT